MYPTGQGTHILIASLHPTSIHAFTHKKTTIKINKGKTNKQTNKQTNRKQQIACLKVSGSVKSNDLLLLNFRLFLHYNTANLQLTFIITMEWAIFPSLLRASQEYSPLSSSTTFAIIR